MAPLMFRHLRYGYEGECNYQSRFLRQEHFVLVVAELRSSSMFLSNFEFMKPLLTGHGNTYKSASSA